MMRQATITNARNTPLRDDCMASNASFPLDDRVLGSVGTARKASLPATEGDIIAASAQMGQCHSQTQFVFSPEEFLNLLE